MAKLNLAAPWYTYYNELCALFKEDKEVHIVYDEMDQIINIYVDNQSKADAMNQVLPTSMDFGNVELEINIVPSNDLNVRKSVGSLFQDLFYKNSICKDVVTIEGIFTNPITYVIFKKEVVQYYNDNLGDAHGICSTLYQDIAKRVFLEKDSIYYCTDTNDYVVSTHDLTNMSYNITATRSPF